jgi:hypothetical protein
MRLYSRPIRGFAIAVLVIVLCSLGARAEWARSFRATRQVATHLDAGESQQAYQFCLSHIADGCEP